MPVSPILSLPLASMPFVPAVAHAVASGQSAPLLCLFTDSLDPSGVGEHMLDLACSLRGRWRVVFACPRGKRGDVFLERARSCGLEVLAIELDARGQPSTEQLRAWLRLNRCAVFHAHAGIGWEGHAAIYEAREAGCAIVRTEHLPYLITEPEQIENHRRLLSSVHRLICVSHAARDSFLEQGLDPTQIKAVCNGISLRQSSIDSQTARANLRCELELPEDAPLLLTIGRFTEQKGHAFLLRALPLLDELQERQGRGGQARLLWVGQGCGREALEEEARAMGLGERVLFLGQREDVPFLLRGADAFVLPSLFEGLPLVALEAMASEVPLVGTRVCGTEEAIGSEECGWLVPPRDPRALALALAQVLEHPQEAARRAQNAARRVREGFTAARMAQETDAVYREALELRERFKVLEGVG